MRPARFHRDFGQRSGKWPFAAHTQQPKRIIKIGTLSPVCRPAVRISSR